MIGSTNQVTGNFQTEVFTVSPAGKDMAETIDFKSILSQTSEKKEPLVSNKNQNTSSEAVQVSKESFTKEKVSTEPASDVKNSSAEDISEDRVLTLEESSAFTELSGSIKELVLNQLEISEEDLAIVMETLGMTYMDFLNPENLAALLVEVSGAGDVSALLTNENLGIDYMNLLDDIGSLQEEVMKALELTTEDMTEQVEIFQQITQEDELPIEQDLLKENQEILKEMKSEKEIVPGKENLSVSIHNSEQEEDPVKMEKEELTALKGMGTEEENQEKTAFVKQDEEKKFDGNKKEGSRTIFADGILNGIAGKADSGFVISATETVSSEAVDFIRQVADQIKTLITEDMSTMELQLNPENLGKLTLHISSKEGIVTAQLIAQNQGVKEVIESQLVQLKENLNAQGVKIEAIEVTVESHQFERNLNQEHSNSKESENHGKRKFSTIFSEEPDIAGSENKIENLVMENGNKVDYTA